MKEEEYLAATAKLAHDLAESAGWEARHAMLEDYNAVEVQQHWMYTARVHQAIDAASGNTDDSSEWNCVQNAILRARLAVSYDPCTNCGVTHDQMRGEERRSAFAAGVRYPERITVLREYTPRPGIELPDGTYFCWVCAWDAAYKWLADPLLANRESILLDLWRQTQADYHTHKGDPTNDRDHDTDTVGDVDEFPEFDGSTPDRA